jgi:hypothetical protein
MALLPHEPSLGRHPSTGRQRFPIAPLGNTTISHLFKIGQRVRQAPSSATVDRDARGDIYEVIRLMPEDRAGALGYRVKSAAGERAVTQDEIVRA